MNILPIIALIFVSAMWGSHAVVGQSVEHHLDPLSLSTWRFSLGAICYFPLLPRLRYIIKLPRNTLWQLGLTGFCWSVMYPILWYEALTLLSPVEALLLVNTSPFLAALIGWLALGERIQIRDWIGILISFLGVIILVSANLSGSSSIVGILVGLSAALAFALYTVSSRRLFQTLPLFDVLLGTSLIGAVILWIFVFMSGQAWQVTESVSQLSQGGWSALIYIVIVVGVIAYVLYGFGLKRLPAAISSAITFYPQVLFAAIIQWIWFGIAPSYITWISAAFILGGTAIMGKRSPAKPPTET